jgi:hypothetical protein
MKPEKYSGAVMLMMKMEEEYVKEEEEKRPRSRKYSPFLAQDCWLPLMPQEGMS